MQDQNNPRISTARNIARKLLAGACITRPPVMIKDIVNLLRKTRDLSVYPWALGENTDGIQATEGSKIAIGYNHSQHPHRQRFTVAHEIGHFLMGHTSANYYNDLKSKDPKEIEANQFAAELLMPLAMLKNDLNDGKKAKELALLYNVSEESMWWRLCDSKLINNL